MRFFILFLALSLLTACSDYYGSDQTDYIAARLAEGAILCHIPATTHIVAYSITTNTRQACLDVGGKPQP